ncbi:3-hydroxybenzoate 6-hydroxylase 1 (plasmid) [Antarctobacter heliothermus]|uniref:3-hydroxybenzoate 6-hydroxylase 1 n=1 Tax=Antarctobacter heliothermus TaxID=74033 RepID=A0A222EC86_9RHOB|nr:3-hydroxybenzoate 6-monooxygenase [Antarctobacter heliothermus]ASP23678.1 3-hydroxybenzoate 6-hydroxylase 1 [Antarctobacter heliothermus]
MAEPIAIAGAGIGGLSAALGLARAGHEIIVLEQAPELGEIGAGIQLGPNAFHSFDHLGIGDEARAVAVYVDALRMMDATDGAEIARMDTGTAFRARFNNPYAVVHRGELHTVLQNACRANARIDIRTGVHVTGYRTGDRKVDVLMDGGDPLTVRALIGADGLRSKVREQMVGDSDLRVSGHATYRTVIPTEKMPPDLRWNMMTLWAGPKCHLVHYPLKGGELFNLVVTYHRGMTEPVSGQPVTNAEVRQGFEHVCDQALQIIDFGENWKLWVLCDRDPIRTWTDGTVALLGDAAHPMMQYLAQGACMAMEDAVNLSHHVGRTGDDIEGALKTYEEQRAARTARVQQTARLFGDFVFHPSGATAHARNTVMRNRTQKEWHDRADWLYARNGLTG